MRRIRSAAVGVAVAGVLITTGAAAKAAPVGPEGSGGKEIATFASQATCHFTADMSLQPGVTPEVTTTNFATIGEVSIYCEGTVNGSPVLPDVAGAYEEWGSTTGDCSAGQGVGEYEGHIPTEAGMQRVTGDFRIWFSDGSGGESSDDDRIEAQFTYTAKVGSCTADDPLVKIHLSQTQTLVT